MFIMKTKILILITLITIEKILCRVIPEENEVKVIIPDKLTPKKEAFFWQRQIILLFVPVNNGLGQVGGINPGGVPIGGIQPGIQGGFNARVRNVNRYRGLRRRTGLRARTTTPGYETMDNEN